MSIAIPDPVFLSSNLENLLGRTVLLKRGAPFRPAPGDAITVASYSFESGKRAALWVCEFGAACSLAAALSMVPAGIASEAAKNRSMDQGLRDNLSEVMNVCSALIGGPGLRLIYDSLILPPEPVPPEIRTILLKPVSRLDLEVTVSGYQPGRIALLAC
ncbi:MAG TPA: hypothetical protein VN033_08365 [Vulgatibacter sp.]|nr:hypothetical protein [Vulgatibacter sp.]